ncbi:LamG domain-containing protein, partial [Candidatus Pacearchaeota archaeon]|nr:LamG domain-containing protein [Candidatus Pacearchaeota archaeon]
KMALIDNIVSYWKFDTDNATQPDSVGNNDGTVNSATFNSNGKIGGNYVYNGTNNYINVPDNASLDFGTDDFTISAWINIDGTTGNNQIVVGKHYSSDPNHIGYTIQITSSGYFQVYLDNRPAITFIQVNDPVNITGDGWHHIIMAVYHSGGTTFVRGYVDGVLRITASQAGDMDFVNNQPLSFGRHAQDNNQYIDGNIDEVGIWNRRLTDGSIALDETATGEIAELYNNGSGLQYPFSEEVTDNAIFFGNNF